MSENKQSMDWAAGLLGTETAGAAEPVAKNAPVEQPEPVAQSPQVDDAPAHTVRDGSGPLGVGRTAFSPAVSSAHLTVFADKIQGKIFDLSLNSMHLGRAASNQIVIQDPCISGKHCVFEVREDGVWLKDLNSANGTFLNGHSAKESILRSGDVIRCGTSILKFEITVKRPRLAPPTAVESAPNGQRPVSRNSQVSHRGELDGGPISFEKISYDTQKSTEKKKGGGGIIIFVLVLLLLGAIGAAIFYLQPSLVPWLSQ